MAATDYEIKSDSPVVSELMFWRLAGHEGLSRPAAYELVVLSKNRNIDAKDILGHAFDVVIGFEDADGGKHQRHFQGHAVRFTRLAQAGRYFEYRIELRSWFWLLSKRANARILQDKPVLEVLDAVIEDSPVKRLKKLKTDQVAGRHEPHRYCVQFQESDYDFLSRLLEEEGIYYWFDAHDAPGTMHLSDNSAVAHEALPAVGTLRYISQSASQAPRQAEITRWVSARRFDTGKHAAADSNFKAIRKKVGATIDASDDHELADLEVFEFPGDYFTPDGAETAAKVRGDELMARRDRHWAFTSWPDVAAGRTFKFEGDPDGVHDGEYIVSGCTMVVAHPGYEGMGLADAAASVVPLLQRLLAEDAVNAVSLDMAQELVEAHPDLVRPGRGACAFLLTLHPVAMPFRPPRLTPRKPMPGPQSAIVVGPKGDELHVDEFGRVKVHFHWDRYDESNEKSTCWVRVSQPWAGKGWGGYFMPRIGQEVIVDFLNGDPDRPIVIGRMYNDDQPIPYKSPTQSGFKTRSTPGGDSTNYNEIMFEDKKGEEALNVHAEKNMSTSVENDDSTTVGHDQSITVENDRTVHTIGNEKREVDKDQRNIIHQHQHTDVTWNQYNHIGQHQQNIIGIKGQFNQIGGKVDMIVGQTYNLNVTGALTQYSASVGLTTGAMTIGAASVAVGTTGNMSFTAQGSRKDVTTGAHLVASSAGVKVVAGTDIELMGMANINATSVGSNTTVMGSNSSGYIGINSEANMGMNRSTFMGLQMDNFLGMSIANAAAIQMENCAAIQMHNVAALDLTDTAVNIENQGVKIINPGAGAGMAAGASVVGALGGLVGGVMGLMDSAATLKQYADAAQALRDTAKELADEGLLPDLQNRLLSLAAAADRRRTQVGTAAGAVVGAVVGGALGGPLGAAAGAAAGSQLGGKYLPGAADSAARAADKAGEAVGGVVDKAWDAAMPSPPADNKAGSVPVGSGTAPGGGAGGPGVAQSNQPPSGAGGASGAGGKSGSVVSDGGKAGGPAAGGADGKGGGPAGAGGKGGGSMGPGGKGG